MNTDLSIVDTSSTNAHIEFRHEMGVIHEIVAECEKEIVFMNQVHDFVYGDERHNMINRLLRLNHRPDDELTRFNRPCIDKVDLEWVKQNIWAEYWKKVTDMTNVLLIMPAARRDEWREQFI
ncbi:DNA modification methylase, partial [Salmonella enterica subsp. enterica serovar Anatum]